ncbi:RNA polymerase sigma factor [Luteolibacter sp. Populi]|uniref:RNA polymerase sigma factor n=1 Tax=Luteolibacter sp. Populi TaxID=3230487 RepID=UPI0034657F51
MTASSLTNDAGFPLAVAPPCGPTPDEVAEAVLIHAAQGGCGDAFRQLVERHQQRVYHFCFHYLRDASDAREACQDTFIRAHRALGGFRPKAKFSTWLFQIALNLCRDRVRAGRNRLTGSWDKGALELPCKRPTPEEVAMRHSDLAKLDRGLGALPEKFREVLVLSCLEGFSHTECAAILKCSERAVEGRLYRARERLAAWWDREAA